MNGGSTEMAKNEESDDKSVAKEKKAEAPSKSARKGYASLAKKNGSPVVTDIEQAVDTTGKAKKVQIRKNLNETAFFYPQLKTNKKGEVIVSFTAPEALTRWRLLALAHTKGLKSTIFENSLVTQKELMVMPNMQIGRAHV